MSVTDLQVEAVGPWTLLVDAKHHQLPQLPSSGWKVLQLILLPVRIHKHRLYIKDEYSHREVKHQRVKVIFALNVLRNTSN